MRVQHIVDPHNPIIVRVRTVVYTHVSTDIIHSTTLTIYYINLLSLTVIEKFSQLSPVHNFYIKSY